MSQVVKTKRQANFKDFKRFGAFKGLVEQKKHCIQLAFLALVAHSYQKKPNLHTNSLNKLLFSTPMFKMQFIAYVSMTS
jgi:hypothetical protein